MMNNIGPFVIGILVAIGMGGCGMFSFVVSQSWKGTHTTQVVSAIDNLTLLVGVGVMGGLFILAFGFIVVLYMRLQQRMQSTPLYQESRGQLSAKDAPTYPPVKNPGTWMSNRNRNVQEIEGDFYELN